MNSAIWIAQCVLAAMMLGAGLFKSLTAVETIKAKMPWAKRYDAQQIRLIGLAEAVAGVGLILPAWLNILPILTPIAAACLVVIMLGAIGSHVKNQENPAPAIVPLALAVFVAVGRFVLVPFV